tara:strand:+ start:2362 stop:2721 length:360 start_codon:yes stop_codon:yes gene_type:complete
LKYLVDTYKTLTETIDYVDLGMFAYGEWIIYEKKKPKYHICCFRENSKSDFIINNLLESKNFSIESIIKQINQKFNRKLNFGRRPLFGFKTKSELTELELKPLPIELVENIKNVVQQRL